MLGTYEYMYTLYSKVLYNLNFKEFFKKIHLSDTYMGKMSREQQWIQLSTRNAKTTK